MKKDLFMFLVLFTSFVHISVFASYTWNDDTTQIYTQNEENVIKSDDIDDPLRAGTTSAAGGIQGVAQGTDEHQQDFVFYLSKWINYFLGFLGLLVIILIIKDGIVMITSAGDEGKKKEAFVNLKNYILALIGIGTSYLLINLIFYFVNLNTGIVGTGI